MIDEAQPPEHPNCRCIPSPVLAPHILPLKQVPSHVAFCLDCGTTRYGSLFVKAIRCTLCNGNNKVTARLRPTE